MISPDVEFVFIAFPAACGSGSIVVAFDVKAVVIAVVVVAVAVDAVVNAKI